MVGWTMESVIRAREDGKFNSMGLNRTVNSFPVGGECFVQLSTWSLAAFSPDMPHHTNAIISGWSYPLPVLMSSTIRYLNVTVNCAGRVKYAICSSLFAGSSK
jgi:hypothetical protein